MSTVIFTLGVLIGAACIFVGISREMHGLTMLGFIIIPVSIVAGLRPPREYA